MDPEKLLSALEADSLSSFMKHLLQIRQDSRQTYSLRAFARTLGLSPAMLSSVLAGKRRLSKTSAERIAEKLALSDSHREYFLLLADLLVVEHEPTQQCIRKRLNDLRAKS